MDSLRIALRAAQYDHYRLEKGIVGDLVICGITPSDGNGELGVITASWKPQLEKDRIDGTQYFAVRIVETEANAVILLPALVRKISSVIFMGKRHKTHAKVDPFAEPREWLLQCNPTGEGVI